MSFYSSTAYKPQIRQEGFNPMNSGSGGGSGSGGSPDGGPSADLFSINSHFLDGPVSRKQPSSSSSSNMDFTDELASFIGTAPTEKNGHAAHHHHQQQHHQYGQDDRPYNIFDTSAPPGASAALNGGAGGNQPGAHPSSVSSTTSGFSVHSEYHHQHHPAPPPFNSTLPALNSSMRYEPHPDPPYNPNNTRHTPSPIHSQPGVHSPHLPPPPPPAHVGVAAAHHHHLNSRSRSRSRPPTSSSSNEGSSAANASASVTAGSAAGGIGPARTTRTRRNNSVSSTSPPPYGRPHAIVIPGSRAGAGGGNGNTWFVSSQSSASDFSLPTPSSEIGPNASHNPSTTPSNGPPHSPLSQTHGYTPFSLSPPNESVLGGGKGQNPLDFSLNQGAGQQGFHNMPGHGIQPHHPPSSHGHGHSHSQSHGYFTPSSSVPSVGGLGSMGGTPHGHHNGHGGGPQSGHTGQHNAHHGGLSSSLPSSSLLNGGMAGGMGMGMGMGMNSLSFGLGGGSSSSQHGGSGSTTTTATLTPGSQTTPGASTAPANATATVNTANLSPQDKQALLANEKRRRRRESHNAVERRRRDNINEKISELATLIPECLLEGPGTGAGGPNSPGGANASSPSALLDTNSDPLLPSSMGGPAPLKKEELKGEDTLDGAGVDAGVVKANKGMILRKSVEYIRYLQQLVTAQGARNRELENELKTYRGQSFSGSTNGTPSHTKSGTTHSTSPSEGGDPDAENKDHESSEAGSSAGGQDVDAEMMLHDGGSSAGGLDFGMGMNVGMGAFNMHPHMRRRGSSGVGRNGAGMLPSMPEGDDENDEALEVGAGGCLSLTGHDGGSEDGIMDVDGLEGLGEERGRTSIRGKRTGLTNGNVPHLKEEMTDDFAVHLGMVGMQQ